MIDDGGHTSNLNVRKHWHRKKRRAWMKAAGKEEWLRGDLSVPKGRRERRAMLRAPERQSKKNARTPLRIVLTWKAEFGKLKESGPSSNLKRNSPQSDSDWGRFPLQIGTWTILGDR